MAQKRPFPAESETADANKRSRQSNGASTPPASNVKLSLQDQIARAKAKAAEIAARRNASQASSAASPAPGGSAAPPSQPAGDSVTDSARARIEAIRARMKAATAGTSSTQSSDAPPQRSAAPAPQWRPPPPPPPEEEARSGLRGLHAALHPALLDTGDKEKDRDSRGRPGQKRNDNRRDGQADKGKRQLDLSGPSFEEIKANPYYDATLTSVAAGSRKSRAIQFNEKGKYIGQAQALRRQAQMEEMKRRIAESARKSGVEEDRSEQSFLVKDVPNVEWWDMELLKGDDDADKRYPDFDDAMEAEKQLRIDTDDTVVTRYIQHPVLLEPPQDKHKPTPKPMFMTKKELAKKRRQDRMEKLKEEQAKVRLGLAPPEPPKIKKSNLMRVLGEQAVKDPTAVEARVNREIAERKDKHERTNEDRALTKEQRHEKLATNQQNDAAKGIHMCAFRISSLANGQHRYKVDINAKQNALTGITLLHPQFCLVVVEGGPRSIAQYKKLMLQRIVWSENAAPTEAARAKEEAGRDISSRHPWLKAEDEAGVLRELGQNKCELVWEGELQDRQFKYWTSRVCETDNEARRLLDKNKMQHMWNMAKAME